MDHCTHGPPPPARRAQTRQLLQWGETLLAGSGIAHPRHEALVLWETAGGDRRWFLDRAAVASPMLAAHYRRLLYARCERIPLRYLTRRVGFMDFELLLGPGVFIPRPETEELAELATRILRTLPHRTLALDLGTGSGALACALARARSDAQVLAVDVAPRALSCARGNVRRLGLSERVEVRRSDWFSRVHERFHLIVGNPPYISLSELSALEPEISVHEPRRALGADADGLSALREILSSLPCHLLSGGWALLEIGHGQGRVARALANRVPGLVETEVYHDMGGRARILAVRWM